MRKRLTDQQISDVTRVMNGFSCIGDSLYTCEKGDPNNCSVYATYYRGSMMGYLFSPDYLQKDVHHPESQFLGNSLFIESLKSLAKNIDSYKITDDWGDFVLKFNAFLPLLVLYIKTISPWSGVSIPDWLREMKEVPGGLNALQNAYYKALSTTFAPPQESMGKIDPACNPYLGLPLYQDLIDADLRIGAFITLYEWTEIASGLSDDWGMVAKVMNPMYCASICDSVAADAMNEIKDKAFNCFPYSKRDTKGDWNSFESFMLSLSSTWNEYITTGALKVSNQQGLKDWVKQMNSIYCEFSCYQQSMVKAVMEIAPPSSGDQKK